MSKAKGQFRNTIIYGAIALLPVLILAYGVYKVHQLVSKVVVAIAPVLGESAFYGTGVILLMTVVSLVLLCFLMGTLVNSQLGANVFETVQSKFGDILPGYEIVTNLMRGIAGNEKAYPPALITLFAPGTSVLGFIMEDLGDAYVTVFVPSTPVVTVGAIHVVERTRVRMIDASSRDAAECIAQWGIGAKELLQSQKPASRS
jgi:uncharacterized membrane protein